MKRDPLALEGREHDVLVIGGGIAGAWVAREGSSRGLSVALVEVGDFGQATSWSSLKTAHGGLRHLQRLDVAGFRESVRERRALLRVAPKIVRPLKFAISAPAPLDELKFFFGGLVNDILSYDRNEGLRGDRAIGTTRLLDQAHAASLGGAALSGAPAFVWEDAQITHTERLVMGLLHAASGAGAAILNRCRLDTGVRPGRADGSSSTDGFEVRATDLVSGRGLTFRARFVVNAAGAQIEEVSRVFAQTCSSPPLIRGVNVVLARDLTPSVAIGARDRGRFLFLVPWLGRSMMGTIYDDGKAPLDALVSELMEAGRRAFPWAGIRDEDIAVVHSGHVPGAPNGEPVYRSRVIHHADPRILSILTAKYTTARATAETVVDEIGRVLSKPLAPSVSAREELPMARPLEGELSERIRQAEETEMAMDRQDAIRGRLSEGGRGEEVDSRGAGA
ncbi:MAG: FAD-dependent oxidoreductase [Vicinamibacteria bacterium]|nr:FAD-dependent oxidoreductase [Vicinamibacteria bacterium]